jgi:cobalt-zinc-cadmium resistance protein CzcA
MAYQAQGSDLRGKMLALFHGAIEVNRPILFAAAIIIAGFIPLFTLSGVEGHIFAPMAKTYAYAIAGGLIATFTITPAFAAMLMPEHVEEAETRLMQVISRFYGPVLLFALRRKSWVLTGAALLLCVAVVITRLLGLEFLPKLEEGNLWIRATLPSTISLDEGNNYVNRMRAIIGNFPEVESVVSQHGRPDDGTDATGFFNAEFFAPLKPASAWPRGMSKEQLTNEMLAKLQDEFLGVEFNFSQYLQDNVSEAVSGVKGENSIKLFGDDLEALTKTASQIKGALASVRGITDLAVFTSLGQPTVQIDIDRARAGRYGLTPGDINSTVRSAIGGDSAGELYVPNSDQHFPIIVRLAPRYRQSPEAIRDIPVAISGEKGPVQIPLSEVATVEVVSGAAYIYREQQQRYLPIKFSVRDRDLGSAIAEAQKKIAQQVVLPAGSRLEWVGEFGNLQEAIGRLRIVVPITLGLIALLLWINFGSLIDTLLTMSVIPMAVVGGLFGLYITGVPFSVSAAIGFIALFGISVMNGIVVLSQYNLLVRGGMERMQAIVQTGALKIRPVLMTCVIAGVGLLPAAISSGIGSQVQKPLAIVVVSGMTFAPFLILVVLPVLIALFPSRASHIRHSQTQERLAG